MNEMEKHKADLIEAEMLFKKGDFNRTIEKTTIVVQFFKEFESWDFWLKGTNIWAKCLLKIQEVKLAKEKANEVYTKAKALGYEEHIEIAISLMTLGNIDTIEGRLDSANSKLLLAKKIIINIEGEESLNLAYLYYLLGICCFDSEKYKEAVFNMEFGKDICKKHKDSEYNLTMMLGSLGMIYSELGYYNKADTVFKEVLKIRIEKLGEEHYETISTFYNIGLFYMKNGDYGYAFDYIIYTLNLAKKTFNSNPNHPIFENIYNGLGNYYENRENYDKAKFYYEKALFVFNANESPNPRVPILAKGNIGNCYNRLGAYDKAIEYHLQALELLMKFENMNPYHIVEYNNSLANDYRSKGDFEQAIKYHKLVFEGEFVKHPKGMESNYEVGITYFMLNDFEAALQYFQNALVCGIFDYKDTDPFNNPTPSGYYSYTHLLESFYYKIQALEAIDPHNLPIALYTCHIASLWISYIRKNLYGNESRLILAKKAHQIYTLGVELSLKAARLAAKFPNNWKTNAKKYDLNLFLSRQDCLLAAYNFMEQSKAMLLFSSLKEVEAKLHLPKELSEEEFELKRKLAFNINQRVKEELKEHSIRNEELIRKYNKQTILLSKEYDEFIRHIEKEYPAYFNQKYDTNSILIENLQHQLKNNKVIIEYHISGKTLYVCVIKKAALLIESFEIPNDLQTHVEEFLYTLNNVDRKKYVEHGYYLYSYLLAPIKHILNEITELIIIPDDYLGTLPFEALLSKQVSSRNSYTDLPYLILDYDISYHYSASLWYESIYRESHIEMLSNDFLGIAPLYKGKVMYVGSRKVLVDGINYQSLKYAIDEVEKVENIFDSNNYSSKVLIDEEASISNVIERMPYFKYILVAGHAIFNKERPSLSGIILSPIKEEKNKNRDEFTYIRNKESNLLYTSDIYTLKLSADLVVLSCCETGLGELFKGEGIMGINRGFFYAGAQNVIFTLFKVYDEQSSQLSTKLFEYIVSGKTYKQSLRLAKIDLIKDKSNDPICWAGYVLIGK